MPDANDILFGNSAPSVSFSVGTTVHGRIVGQDGSHRREVKHDRKTDTYVQGKPYYWDNGLPSTKVTDRPVMDAVITIQTDITDWSAISSQSAKLGKDDGLRRIFLKGRSKASPDSLRDAAILAAGNAGVRKVELGDFIEITCTGEGKKQGAANPPKLYTATYWPASTPPEWASTLYGANDTNDDSSEDDDGDDPFQ